MAWLNNITDKFGAWSRSRRVFNELSAYSDRELQDIGLRRDDIPYIAANAARSAEAVYPFARTVPAAQSKTAKIAGARPGAERAPAFLHAYSAQLP